MLPVPVEAQIQPGMQQVMFQGAAGVVRAFADHRPSRSPDGVRTFPRLRQHKASAGSQKANQKK
ncbi:hypothetical protein GCM10023189_19320 [Nibrella saemangeumensis]|uniref:Uncharacterized protein n=1 Tax=Nibrella saemangeumensis TaxID=1084526 RepID=A0ABP8MP04_9BACT